MLSDVTGIPSSSTLVQHVEPPDVEKEVKRLLHSDAEAISVRILYTKYFLCSLVHPECTW